MEVAATVLVSPVPDGVVVSKSDIGKETEVRGKIGVVVIDAAAPNGLVTEVGAEPRVVGVITVSGS